MFRKEPGENTSINHFQSPLWRFARWGNWGFWIDNSTNLPLKLHPLMEFNKAFLDYEKIEGARCLTADFPMSQLEAAAIGVRTIGLNQIREVERDWFCNQAEWEMFLRRLDLLKK